MSPSMRRLLGAVWLLVILGATLWPMAGPSREWATCLACGDHGSADFLLNIALFAPLGAALVGYPVRLSYIVLIGALLSASIEVAQLYIPGRDATLGDVVSNTMGTAVGALLVRRHALQKAHSRAATLIATLVCFATGLLLTPTFPPAQYFGMWTPNLGHLGWYRGHVRDARVSGARITTGPIPDSRSIRDALTADSGYSVVVRGVAGPRPTRLSPLFAIYDEGRREILLIGPDHDDLVLRFHTYAADWRFDRPDLRAQDGLRAVARGDSLALAIKRHGHAYAIAIEGRTYRPIGYKIGDGWGLLLYPEALAPLKAALGIIWVAALFLPAGFWIRRKSDAVFAAGGIIAGLLGAPLFTPLLPTPAIQWLAAPLGLAAGFVLHVLSSPTSAPTQRSIRA